MVEPVRDPFKSDQYKYRTELLCEKLRAGRLTGSIACAKQTAKLVELLVDIGDRVGMYHDAESLVERLKELRAKLQAAGPEQVSITNLILRVLHLIRTEPSGDDAELLDQPASSPDQPLLLQQPSPPLRMFGRVVSLSNIMEQPVIDAARAADRRELSDHPEHETDSADASADQLSMLRIREGQEQDAWPGKQALLSTLRELWQELDGIEGQVAEQSKGLVLNNHKILTFGFDETVLRVLKEARKAQRSFTVYVALQEPHMSGLLMVRALQAAGVRVVAIFDADVFGIMDRMDKVFLGVHCFLANGAIVSRAGARVVAEVAAVFHVPVLAFGGHHKLCPVFMGDDMRSGVEPSLPMMAFTRFQAAVACPEGVDPRCIHVRVSMYDVVASQHVTLLVTDEGVHQPSYLPSFLPNYYCREDFALALQLFE